MAKLLQLFERNICKYRAWKDHLSACTRSIRRNIYNVRLMKIIAKKFMICNYDKTKKFMWNLIYSLKCQICISPVEIHMANLIKWYFNSSDSNNTVKNAVQNSDYIFNSPDNQYIMYNVKVSSKCVCMWCTNTKIICKKSSFLS